MCYVLLEIRPPIFKSPKTSSQIDMISGKIINIDPAVITVTFIFPLAVPISYFETKLVQNKGN